MWVLESRIPRVMRADLPVVYETFEKVPQRRTTTRIRMAMYSLGCMITSWCSGSKMELESRSVGGLRPGPCGTLRYLTTGPRDTATPIQRVVGVLWRADPAPSATPMKVSHSVCRVDPSKTVRRKYSSRQASGSNLLEKVYITQRESISGWHAEPYVGI